MDHPWTTERKVLKERAKVRRIPERVVKLASKNPFFGYRRVAALLKGGGFGRTSSGCTGS